MHAKIESKSKSEKKKSIALQQSSNYKAIKQRGKKDNPIFLYCHGIIGKHTYQAKPWILWPVRYCWQVLSGNHRVHTCPSPQLPNSTRPKVHIVPMSTSLSPHVPGSASPRIPNVSERILFRVHTSQSSHRLRVHTSLGPHFLESTRSQVHTSLSPSVPESTRPRVHTSPSPHVPESTRPRVHPSQSPHVPESNRFQVRIPPLTARRTHF